MVERELPIWMGLIVAATVLAVAAKRVRLPYNVALVVGGMLLAVGGVLPDVPRLDPAVVLLLCLPALLFEGGIGADLGNIRANSIPIGVLSVLGMALAVGVTGAALHGALELAWSSALLLGAILSVTDTISVLYAFRRAPVPSRLSGVVQGESLFNDGTALVAYSALAAWVAGRTPSLSAMGAQMVLTTLGGLVVGLSLGLAASFLIRRTEDPLTEIMTSTALAIGAYALAEQFHLSGAIAAVTAGLTVGATLRRDVRPQSQVAMNSFWEYVAFGINTFLFLSVGLSTRPQSLLANLPNTLLALGCVFLGRAVAIYLSFLLLRWLRPADAMPLRWQHVFVLGNIKGALSIALVLGLPSALPDRALLVDVTFGVSFLSLVAQGTFFPWALKSMRLLVLDPVAERMGEHQAQLITARAARAELEQLHLAGLVPRDGYEHLRSEYQITIARVEKELRRLQERHLAQGARVLLGTRRRLVDAERTALLSARRSGLVPDDAAERLLNQLDERLVDLEKVLTDNEREEREGGGG